MLRLNPRNALECHAIAIGDTVNASIQRLNASWISRSIIALIYKYNIFGLELVSKLGSIRTDQTASINVTLAIPVRNPYLVSGRGR